MGHASAAFQSSLDAGGGGAKGEIVSVTGDLITVSGYFNPGLVIAMHPGARVVVLTEEELAGLLGVKGLL